ncbi:uncharacterized protein LOC143317236 isoform X2 [Chaetodon auriga]|uniref:uncharacterized protein LOC143317236 isoform X2 n=1 Tax=Chaetodon auriga TaxID=39042 RepID=UPI004032B50C
MDLKLFLSLFILLFAANHVSGENVNAGDSVNLTAYKSCADGDGFKLTTRDNSVTVATLVGGVWRPEEIYEGRIEHLSASSVCLSRVNFNDRGAFEFVCGGNDDSPSVTQLTVVVPYDMAVSDGGAALLPCHASTDGDTQKVRWERNGELVLELDRFSGRVSHGPGFEGRGSVPPDWKSTGNLSLTLERVQHEDEGQFTCYIISKDGKTKMGEPPAVRMRVNERKQTTGPPPSTPGPPGMSTGLTVSIVFNVILGFLVFLLLLVLCLKSRRRQTRRTARSAGREGAPERDVEDELVPHSRVTLSQVSGA